MGIPSEWLGQYIDRDEVALAEKWSEELPRDDLPVAKFNGWEIGDWIISSIHSFLRTDDLNLESEEIESTFRRFLFSGLTSAFGLSRLLDEYEPDVLFLFNGRFSSTRVALELARKKGIRVVCHERGLRHENLTLYKDVNCHDMGDARRVWEQWGNVPLTREELGRIHGYLDDRRHGKNIGWRAMTSQPQDRRRVQDALEIPPDKTVWVLYTSSGDEVATAPDWQGAFQVQEDWIEETIRFVAQHPSILLVIRVHPNTAGRFAAGENRGELEKMLELGENLPENVRMVMPDDDISSYTLMDISTVGLCYQSTVGLEMACTGAHVAVSGGSWYSTMPFVTTVVERDAYDSILEKFVSVKEGHRDIEIQRLANRYAYGIFYRWSINFPLVEMPTPHTGRLRYTDVEALQEGCDESLDRVCKIILDDQPIVMDPTEEEERRSLEEENQWYQRIEDQGSMTEVEFKKLETAYASYEEGHLSEALRHLFQALAMNPKSAETLNKIGVIHQLQGKRKNAIGYFKKSLEMDKTNRNAILNVARTLKMAGRSDTAMSLLEGHLEQWPADEDALLLLNITDEQELAAVAWAI